MTIMNTVKLLGLATALMIGAAGCDVDVEDKGELPEVNVEGGRAPDVDVTPPDIDVETGTREVEVPTVDLDVDVPEENEQ